MKLVKIVVYIIIAWNVFAIASAMVLDVIDPYYAVHQNEYKLTEEEIIAECPEVMISEADKKLLLSILNDNAVLENLPVEYGNMLWLSDEDCSRIIGQYEEAPTDICRISVSQSGVTTYASIEFYETEDDKGRAPSVAYPCLCLKLRTKGYSSQFYSKEIYNYSLKVPYNRIGTSSWGGPDATYIRYIYDTSPTDTPKREEKTLTLMKHRHLYLRYFGWYEALMSV